MLNYLRARTDGLQETDKDGVIWQQVYTADIHIPGIESNQNSGYLSALEKVGFYRKMDKYFGMVRKGNCNVK